MTNSNEGQLEESNNDDMTENDIFSNVDYICKASPVICEALRKGGDVVQMPNGDIIVTEVKIVNTYYKWDFQKQKVVKVSNSQ